MYSPVVSIVTPCYNNGKTIAETIESVVSQTFPYWEMVCVDDGSTDNTVEIINQYCERDKRIKLINRDKEPSGGSHCRNIGAFAAQGEYLIFLDGDDLLATTCLERRINVISGTENEFVVFPMGRFKNNDINALVNEGKLYKNRDYLYYYASGNAGWPITSPIIRTSFFRSLGGYDISFLRLQDIEYNLRAIVFSKGKYYIDFSSDNDCFYRIGTAISSSLTSKLIKAFFSYEKFMNLIVILDEEIAFNNRRRLSLAVLNVCCNYIIDYCLTRGEKQLHKPTWDDKKIFLSKMLRRERFWFRVLNTFCFSTHIYYWVARIMSKMIRNRFVQ